MAEPDDPTRTPGGGPDNSDAEPTCVLPAGGNTAEPTTPLPDPTWAQAAPDNWAASNPTPAPADQFEPTAQFPPGWGYGGQPGPYSYGQQPYGQQPVPYGQAPYGAPSYGGAMAPAHPSATTAMILGIGALGGMFICFVPILLAPFAWIVGGRAVKEIDANPGRYSGREQAQAGRIMGMIGTGLLALMFLAFFALFAVGMSAGFSDDSSYDDPYSDTGSSF